MILALLVAANTIGVLEFRNKTDLDAAYLSDQVRTAVKDVSPRAKVITRENMLVLLQASGKDLAACEGECEVDTGRRIGADMVVSGELLRFGTQYKLNMKLHDTRSGDLLSGAVASGATADELDRALRPAVDKLLAPLGQAQAPAEPSFARPAFSAHAAGGFGSVTGNVALVTLPFGSTGTGAASAPSFGLGIDAGAHLGAVFTLNAYFDYVAVPTDTFVHLVVYGVNARVQAADKLFLTGGLGFSRLATSVSGPSFLGALDYAFHPPFAFHAEVLYAHEANSDGLFNGENTVLFVGAGISLLF